MILRAAILLAGAALGAEPLVTGFERFHAATPTAEGGRLLYNELGCVNCHGGATGLPALRGPALATVTQRVRSEWLRKFVADPASVHPGTVMPQVLAKADDKTLVAIEHYLASLKPKTASKGPAKIMHVNGARGGELFNTLGCVACHAPGKGFVPPDGLPKASEFTHRSVGFGDLKAKHSLDSLANFIVDPLKVRTDGRMPKTTMVKQDAIDIAGYLLEFQGSDGRTDVPVVSVTADKNLAIAGRKAVIAAQCAACHDLPKDAAAKPVALKKTEGGCLDADHTKGPRYALSEAQRASLKLFLAKKDEVASAKLAATSLCTRSTASLAMSATAREAPTPAVSLISKGTIISATPDDIRRPSPASAGSSARSGSPTCSLSARRPKAPISLRRTTAVSPIASGLT
jgi:cytochrome c553